jgi:hypothetical protein
MDSAVGLSYSGPDSDYVF